MTANVWLSHYPAFGIKWKTRHCITKVTWVSGFVEDKNCLRWRNLAH